MNQGNSDAALVYDAEVVDSAGQKLGTVDGVWVDDATNELEFIGVKTGFLMGKTHVIPTADARIERGTVTVPYPENQIKGAPSFGPDQEFTPEDEDGIYRYYGLNRSTAPSPSGLPTDASTAASTDVGATGDMPTPPTHVEMTLGEEDLVVGKRQVEAGRVRLRKVVRTEHQEVPVELRRENVSVERVPVSPQADDGSAFQAREIDVPVMHEEAVVCKEGHATEQVRLNKTATAESRTVGGDVRREDVEIDQGAVDEYVHTPDEAR